LFGTNQAVPDSSKHASANSFRLRQLHESYIPTPGKNALHTTYHIKQLPVSLTVKYVHVPNPQASSELGIILKQHNALGVQEANAARNNSINESTRFLDKLVEVLLATCICCSLRSLPCLVQQRPQDSHSNSSASNLFRRRLDQADSDGTTTIFFLTICLAHILSKPHTFVHS
jgi:hypothetical protein